MAEKKTEYEFMQEIKELKNDLWETEKSRKAILADNEELRLRLAEVRGFNVELITEKSDLKKQVAVMQAEYVEAWERIRSLEEKKEAA